MNRRIFLKTAGAASLAPLILTSRKSTAQSSGLDPNLIQACSISNAVALGNLWAGTSSRDDWRGVINAHYNLQQAVLAGNLDPAFSGGVPDSVDVGAFDPGPPTQFMQQWQPSFQTWDTMNYYNLTPKDPSSIMQACQGLQTSGLSGHCATVIRQAMAMQRALSAPVGGLGFGMGGGGMSCPGDAMANLAVGTAFVVIGLMVWPIGVLALAFWGPLALWGGVGCGVWALGHAAVCQF